MLCVLEMDESMKGGKTSREVEMNKKTARIDGRGNVSRTCGFCVVPTESLQPLTRLAYDALMFIGGAPGSAAAGMKVTTFAVLIYTLTAMCRNERETVIDQLLAVCAEYTNATKRIITFEYTVIRGAIPAPSPRNWRGRCGGCRWRRST